MALLRSHGRLIFWRRASLAVAFNAYRGREQDKETIAVDHLGGNEGMGEISKGGIGGETSYHTEPSQLKSCRNE